MRNGYRPNLFHLLYPVLSALLLFAGCRPSPDEAPRVTDGAPVSGAGKLTYVQIDVGQGDSSLIVSPGGHAMLVDAGPPGYSDEILEILRQHGVDRLDYLVESHPHADHIGSMRQVIAQGPPVGTFIASGYRHKSQVQVNLLKEIRGRKIGGKLARAGDRYTLGDSVSFTILQPKPPLIKGTESDPNNNSVVLQVSYGNARFLLTGDMEKEERERLLTTRDDLQSDVLKLAHHGSHDGIDTGFLRRVRPKAVLISCAAGNDYGHPHIETMGILKDAGTTIYRTDLQGTVTLVSDGNEFEAAVQKKASLPLLLTGKEVETRIGETPRPPAPDARDLSSLTENPPGPDTDRGKGDRADSAEAGQPGGVENGPIIGNRRSKVYHREGTNAQLPAPQNRVYFRTEEEARDAGFRPAKR